MALPESQRYDLIRVLGLTAHGRHGVYPTERAEGQPFTVDVTMYVDTRRAADTDDLKHTVDYSEVAQRVAQILSGSPVNLIETLAQRVADAVLDFPAVQIVEVEVHKPYAPMQCEFSDVTMTIRRHRDTADEDVATVPAKSSVDAQSVGTQPGRSSATEKPVAAEPAAPSTAQKSAAPVAAKLSAAEKPGPGTKRSAQKDAEDEPRVLSPRDEDVVLEAPLFAAVSRAAGWRQSAPAPVGASTPETAPTPAAVGSPAAAGSRQSAPAPAGASTPQTAPAPEIQPQPQAKPATRRRRGATTATNRAILGLGANLGNAPHVLAQAVKELDSAGEIEVRGVSGLFRSAPLLAPGQDPQPDYYNAVVQVETVLSARELLDAVHWVEAQHGRQRRERWGARTLDIDLIIFNEDELDDPQLTVPHPRAAQRAFVLVPWLQIDSQATLQGQAVAALVQAVADQQLEQLDDSWVEEAASDENWVPTADRAASEPAAAAHLETTVSSGQSGDEPHTATKEPVEAASQTNAPSSSYDCGRSTRRPALSRPHWQQAVRAAQPRIVEDDGESIFTTREQPAQCESVALAQREGTAAAQRQPVPAPQREAAAAPAPKLEPNLPAGIAKGPLPIEQDEVTISRETVMRPTATGLIPVTKRGHRPQDRS